MIGALKNFVEKIEGTKKGFWFEDRSKEADGKILFLDNVFVAVGKRLQKDRNGRVCDVLDVKFVPLNMDRQKTKLTDLLSGEEIAIKSKNSKIMLSAHPTALSSFEKTKECYQVMEFMTFFGEYGDYFKKAFPKTDFTKMLNLNTLSRRRDVSEGDIKKLISKVEKEYFKSVQQSKSQKTKAVPNFK